MALSDSVKLIVDGNFVARVQEQIVSSAISIYNEIANDVQTITMGSVTAGTFTLTFLGQTTSALQWNSSALAIQTALQALSTIGANNVECTGGPLPGTGVVINFTGTMVGAFPLITHTDTLTGGVATVTHTTTGVWAAKHTTRQQLATNVLRNPSGYAALMVAGVATDATVLTDYGANGVNGQSAVTDAHIATAVASIWNAYAG